MNLGQRWWEGESRVKAMPCTYNPRFIHQSRRHGWVERLQILKSKLKLLFLSFISLVTLLLGTSFKNPTAVISPILIMVLFQQTSWVCGFVLKINLGNRFKEVERHLPSTKYTLALSQTEADHLEKHPTPSAWLASSQWNYRRVVRRLGADTGTKEGLWT